MERRGEERNGRDWRGEEGSGLVLFFLVLEVESYG